MKKAIVCSIFTCAAAAMAQAEPATADGALRCIAINEIRRTEVVDDKTILFHLKNKKVYRNELPQRCPSLSYGRAFKYETSQHQLCNVDLISVINHTTGESIAGAVCGLGMFVPAQAATAK